MKLGIGHLNIEHNSISSGLLSGIDNLATFDYKLYDCVLGSQSINEVLPAWRIHYNEITNPSDLKVLLLEPSAEDTDIAPCVFPLPRL